MIRHWTGLVSFSLTVLPAGLAMVSGPIPHRLWHRLAPMGSCGLALLALYAAALNAVLRLTEAPPVITLVATATAGIAAADCAYTGLTLCRVEEATP